MLMRSSIPLGWTGHLAVETLPMCSGDNNPYAEIQGARAIARQCPDSSGENVTKKAKQAAQGPGQRGDTPPNTGPTWQVRDNVYACFRCGQMVGLEPSEIHRACLKCGYRVYLKAELVASVDRVYRAV